MRRLGEEDLASSLEWDGGAVGLRCQRLEAIGELLRRPVVQQERSAGSAPKWFSTKAAATTTPFLIPSSPGTWASALILHIPQHAGSSRRMNLAREGNADRRVAAIAGETLVSGAIVQRASSRPPVPLPASSCAEQESLLGRGNHA